MSDFGPNPVVRPGFVVALSELPKCDFADKGGCSSSEAHYDFRTIFGPWANGCYTHFRMFGASENLGVGHGQRLVVR